MNTNMKRSNKNNNQNKKFNNKRPSETNGNGNQNKTNNKPIKKKSKTRDFLKTKKNEVIDYFPRDENDEDFTFNMASVEKQNTLFGSKTDLLKKKRKKPKATEKDLEEELEDVEFKQDEETSKLTSRALLPNFKVGDLVLLCISEIRQTYMIANFTRNKKAMIHVNYSGFDPQEDGFSFNKYFKIGQFVCGAVVSPGNDIQLDQGYMNKKILVSIDPKIVNTNLDKNNLAEGMDIWGKFIFDKNTQTYTADFGLNQKDLEDELNDLNKNFMDFDDENENEAFNEEDEEQGENEENEAFDEEEEFDENEENELDLEENEGFNDEENENEENEGEEFEEENEDFGIKGNLRKKNSNQRLELKVKILDLEKDSENFEPEILTKKFLNSYYFFKIIKIEKTKTELILSVSLSQNKLKFGIKKIDFSQIRPGFLFKASITRELVNGVEIAYGGNIGSIFNDHLKSNNLKSKNFLVRVTHISVAKKNVSLSSLTNVINLFTENVEEKKSLIGQEFSNVKLLKELFGGSFSVSLKENLNGFIHKKNIGMVNSSSDIKNELPENLENNAENTLEENDEENNKKKNSKKNKKKKNNRKEMENSLDDNLIKEGNFINNIIIKEYNYFDDTPILKSMDNSEKNNNSNEKENDSNFLTWENLKVGQTISSTIKEIHGDYIMVSINNFITGKILKENLCDYLFNTIPKKFSVGNKLTCRVFKLDYLNKNIQFIAKESLMDDSINLYANLDEISEGIEIPVIYLGNNLFQHTGSVIGKLANFQLADAKMKFKKGKLYNLNVFKVDLKNKRLFLSVDKNVYVPSFGDFENFLRRNSILLTIMNYLNSNEEENAAMENMRKNKKKNKNFEENETKNPEEYLSEINEGDFYDFEIIPVHKILKMLKKKGIEADLLIDENFELFTQKILFVKLPKFNFFGFLQVELLSDFFNEKQFRILFELCKDPSPLNDINSEENNFGNLRISENKKLLKKLLIVHFDKEKKILFTSGKQSLFKFNSEGIIPKTKEELFDNKNSLYCGFVNKVNDKGIIVQFFGKNKFLIKFKNNRNKTENENENNNTLNDDKNQSINVNDEFLNSYTSGQTILVASTYDKKNDKLKFSTGLDVYRNSAIFEGNNYYKEISALKKEADFYLNSYDNDFKFCSQHTKSFIDLLEFNSEINNGKIEGKVNLLSNDKILISIKNQQNLTGCLRTENSKFWENVSNNENERDLLHKKVFENYSTNKIYDFNVIDIDYEKEIIYLTDKAQITKENVINNNKLIGTNQNFIINFISNNYISCHWEKNSNIQGIIPSNFFNFNYEKIQGNINAKNLSENANLLNINDKISLKVLKFDEVNNKFILNFPEKEISESLKSIMKLHFSYINSTSNFSSRKNSDASERFGGNLIPGKILKRTINGIKKNYLFVYIDKTTIGRIAKKDFNGDFDDIKNLLANSAKISKNNSRKNSEDSMNSENKLEKEMKKSLKMKFKILHVEEKNKIKIVDLININNNTKESNLTKINFTDDRKKLDGEFAFKGIISKIDFTSKFPIRIDYGNSEKESGFNVHFSNLINLNSVENKNKEINLNSLYNLGEEIYFYLKKNSEGISASLIPFSKLESQKKQPEIEKKYLMRIMKSFPGSGFAVSIYEEKGNKKLENNSNEAFVEIIEISDELFSNPLNVYKNGQIIIGRILQYDQKAKKYFASFRNSIVNDNLFDILKNGSTIKYSKYFDEFEKRGDMRNKIFKFGSEISLENNKILLGYIKSSNEKGVFINLGKKTICRAPLKEISDEKTSKPHLLFKQSQLVICRIISIFKNENSNEADEDKKSPMINVSLRQSVIKHNMSLKKKDLNQSNFYECYLISENDENFEVGVIGSTFTGHLEKTTAYMKKDANSFKNLKDAKENKQSVYLELVECDKNNNPLRLKFSNLNIDNNFDRKLVINLSSEEILKENQINEELLQSVKMINQKESENEISEELNQLEKETNDVDFEALLNTNELNEEENEEENENENEEENEFEEEEFDEDNEDYEMDNLIVDHDIKSKFLKGDLLSNKNKTLRKNSKNSQNSQKSNDENKMQLDEEAQYENSENNSEQEQMEIEEDEEDQNNNNKENTKSKKNKQKSHLKQELEIREKESEKKIGEYNSVEDYEKLILSDPQNSLYWIQYSAFILDNLGMEACRKIMDRAVHTIDISNLKDKMNLWIAYMNLENTYGTQENFRTVVERALLVNEKREIYKHLINIYKISGKFNLAFEIFKICIKEYFEDINVWKSFIEFLYEVRSEKVKNENNVNFLKKLDDVFDIKEGLNRCYQTLGKSRHFEIELFNAQMQYKYGFIEEARTSFEILLKHHPKRSDIWNVYIDKEIKIVKNPEKIRHIFEKCLTVDFKIKALKTIIKKYLEYEKENGNKKSIDHVVQLTQKLISKKMADVQKNEENNEMEIDE